ncbi:hypothetical protein OBBRIDRAFT_883742 [Obba rivulosa]|uniref:Uncharacterized protein n=1 Tax=Obba rivulosa TaxID=1052685 RepID=A0A8E2DU21_9APHY|nr:hypothetical protein OBBRIDRAFT_883742 [Obba rivulosa]
MNAEDKLRLALLSRYSLKWLYATFNSRQRVEELLRPELEEGTINQHDYVLAATFLPGPHRHYPAMYAATFGLALAAFGYLRKPRWSRMRLAAASSTAALVGVLQGSVNQIRAINKFKQQLEDPGAFATALHHCHERTGILEKYKWMLPPGVEERLKGETTHADDESWSSDSRGVDSPNTLPNVQRADIPNHSAPDSEYHRHSRWDELRAAKARNDASVSSWESLRQTRDRQQVSRPRADDQPEMDERAMEQAKFDAMMEEERRKAMGLSASES